MVTSHRRSNSLRDEISAEQPPHSTAVKSSNTTMTPRKRNANTFIDETQSLAPKQQKISTAIPNFRKPLKIVIVNRRAAPDTTPTPSPSKMASRKRKADTLVNDMRVLAKNILKKHKTAPEINKTATKSRKPLKIIIVNRREAKDNNGSKNVDENGTEDNIDATRPRTTFHDLPRELRQSILLLARPWRTAWTEEKKWMAKTISVFKEVNPRLLDDVEYVEKKWMRSLTEELRGAGFTWKSLSKKEKPLHYAGRIRIGRACAGDSK